MTTDPIHYCKHCHGYEECQFGQDNRGYEPIIDRYLFNGEFIEYVAWQKCRFKRRAEQREQVNTLFERSGLPIKYRNQRLKDLPITSEQFIQYADFVNGKRTSLVITGESARTAAISIGNELINRSIEVLYATVSELLTDLRYDNPDYNTNLTKYLNTATLIIESVGSERRSEYNEEQLAMVLERRQRKNLRSAVTLWNNLSDLSRYSVLKEQLTNEARG